LTQQSHPADDYVTALLIALTDGPDGPEPIPAALAPAIDQAAHGTDTTAAGRPPLSPSSARALKT